MKKFFVIAFFLLLVGKANAENYSLESMTLRQKIGQLFIIRPDQLDTRLSLEEIHNRNAPGVKHMNIRMIDILRKYPAGGFAFFRKNIEDPRQLQNFVKTLKNSCEISPIIAIDEEGGQISRIANHANFNVKKFPSVKSIGESGSAYEAGFIIGEYLKDYGFNFDFAPVADINTNPENIIIGDRAFGSDPERVAKLAGEFLDGLHAHKIAGSLKHFPGHGDTKEDTHKSRAVVYKTWPELLKAEIIPFRENFSKADSVMIAHINMKNITSDDLPATLSHEIITGKLRNELSYDGVIITDALMMDAISEYYGSGEAAILAIEAGCDILLMPNDYRKAFNELMTAVISGRISEARINESVSRILNLKGRL